MRQSSKKARYQLINPSHKDKVAPAEIELLHTRALICVRNFTHYKGGPEALASMERLCRDYKKYKNEVKKNIMKVFDYLREKATENKEDLAALEEKIKEAKAEINKVAKKVWG